MTIVDTMAPWTPEGAQLVAARRRNRRRAAWLGAIPGAAAAALLVAGFFTSSDASGTTRQVVFTAAAFWLAYAAQLVIETAVQRREAVLARAMSRRITDARPHTIEGAVGRWSWRWILVIWTLLSIDCAISLWVSGWPSQGTVIAALWISLTAPAWYLARRAARAPVLAIDAGSLEFDAKQRRERTIQTLNGITLGIMLQVSLRQHEAQGGLIHLVGLLAVLAPLCSLVLILGPRR